MREACETNTFEFLIFSIIMLNALFLGAQTEYGAKFPDDDPPLAFIVISIVFAVIFTTEVGLRIAVYGCQFWYSPSSWHWNYFDTFIVLIGIFETSETLAGLLNADGSSSSGSSGLRVARMIRIARLARAMRVARVMNFVRALRDLVVTILYTLRSLAWSMILLTIIIYVFGIIFTQAASDKESVADMVERLGAEDEVVIARADLWGSLGLSMLTLFQCITSGIDWGDAVLPLRELGYMWLLIFLFYLTFCFFAVLNVVTSVFCQSAMESGQLDLDAVIYNNLQGKTNYKRRLVNLFNFLDCGNTGVVTSQDFTACCLDENVEAYFAALELDVTDGPRLFSLIDSNCDGFVSRDEFVAGCCRLRGKASHIATAILSENSRRLDGNIAEVRRSLGSLASMLGWLDPALCRLDTQRECAAEAEEGNSVANAGFGHDDVVDTLSHKGERWESVLV
eukprot:NODE_4863_length_1837_cov_11.325731.p1 GENE.NODE_4863_length_1837_cov_11.325731~~NODE_4863_length_1837_cov_11.325731.p1  ORF type:complete len:452 (-),score=119.50 NODE_4863_length_1837_cov_11.325731:104-1459(-)